MDHLQNGCSHICLLGEVLVPTGAKGDRHHIARGGDMLPLFPHTPAACLLIVIQSLTRFILQIPTRSLLVLDDGGLTGGPKLWYMTPLSTASLCCWFVFIHSLHWSRCWLTGHGAGLPTLGLHFCLAVLV